MELTEQYLSILYQAIKEYDYPTRLWDFERKQAIDFRTMRELESYLRVRLLSNNPCEAKFALANIVYWGNLGAGYCKSRVARFLDSATEPQIYKAIDLFRNIRGDGLADIKEVRLPEFSNMSFASKLRMFLEPHNFVTLDMKLLKLKESNVRTFFDNVKKYGTYIPINNHNCEQYRIWSGKCKSTATKYFRDQGIIAADVERGIFHLVDQGKVNTAATLVAKMPNSTHSS